MNPSDFSSQFQYQGHGPTDFTHPAGPRYYLYLIREPNESERAWDKRKEAAATEWHANCTYHGFKRKTTERPEDWARRKKGIDMLVVKEQEGPKEPTAFGAPKQMLRDDFAGIRKTDAPKKKAPVNLNPRSREYMEGKGYVYQTTEHYDTRTMRKHDHMGIFDALCYKVAQGSFDAPDYVPGETVGVQITTQANKGARLRKMQASPHLATFKAAGNRVLLLTWLKNAKGRWEAEETWL